MSGALKSLFDPARRDRTWEVLHWFLVAAVCLAAWGWVGYNWYSGHRADAYAQGILLEELEGDLFIHTRSKPNRRENGVVLEFVIPGMMGVVSYDRPTLFGDTERVSVTITLFDDRVRRYYSESTVSKALAYSY